MSPHLPALVALVAFLAFAPRAYGGVWDDADESPTLRRTVWPLANWTVPDFPNSQEADGQVVGGVDATDHQFPHQVSMQITGAPYATQHICGGMLIAEQWVLTAAHCAWGVPEFTSVFVLVGKTNLAKQEDGQQKAWVSQMFAHKSYRPNWNRGVGPHDVALLKLLQPVTLSATVKPAVLPEDNAVPTGSATLSGWGSISSLSEIILPSQLQTTELPINSFETCKKWIDEAEPEEINALRDTNVCAGDLTRAGVSSCQGDSGGPLTQKSASGDVAVIGVVSWGYVPCGRAPAPSVFARVSAYNSWIRDTMSSNS